MTREEMAKKVYDVSEQAALAQGFECIPFDELGQWQRDCMFAVADAALAVVREAVRDAYREGAIDTVNVNGQVNSFIGAEFSEMAYDEIARWEISDSNAKWSEK